jgi:DNA-binding CsgD family transcriptional regulator
MQLQRYLDVSQAGTVDALRQQLVGFANHIGFGLVNAMLMLERPGMKAAMYTVSNMPNGFEEASKDNTDSSRDPVLKRLKRLNVPFLYDQELYAAEGAGDLWEQQAAFGYKTGIAVALHLPAHRHFLLGFDREQALPKQDDKLIRMLADLQFLAVHAQDAAMRLLVSSDDPSHPPKLTSREIEILQWTLEGKSASAVGGILHISENTVNFHMRNIFRKLNASSKHQAAIKAMSLGLL